MQILPWPTKQDVPQTLPEEKPPELLHDAENIKLQFDLVQNQDHYASLETISRQGLKEEENEDLIKWNYGLLEMSYKLENIMPALSIVFARAAVMGRPNALLDNEMLDKTPLGLQFTKEVLNQNRHAASLESALELENRNQSILCMTPEFFKAVEKFGQRKKSE